MILTPSQDFDNSVARKIVLCKADLLEFRINPGIAVTACFLLFSNFRAFYIQADLIAEF